MTSPTDDSTLKRAVREYTRVHGKRPMSKDALDVKDLASMVTFCEENGLIWTRDKALLLLGFAGAFRRSELTALNVEDLQFDDAVLYVLVKRSKTDQTGEGMYKVIFPSKDPLLSPIEAIKNWLAYLNVDKGPIFRKIDRWGHVQMDRLTPQSIALILKRLTACISSTKNYSGHSLRSGFVTQAIRQGATERSIMYQTGHRSLVVLQSYIHRKNLREDNAAQFVL